jgi:hypothetical protein
MTFRLSLALLSVIAPPYKLTKVVQRWTLTACIRMNIALIFILSVWIIWTKSREEKRPIAKTIGFLTKMIGKIYCANRAASATIPHLFLQLTKSPANKPELGGLCGRCPYTV